MKPLLMAFLGVLLTTLVVTATAQDETCPPNLGRYVDNFKATLHQCANDAYDDIISSLKRHTPSSSPAEYGDTNDPDYGSGADK